MGNSAKKHGLERKVTRIEAQGDAPCEKFSREFCAKCVTLVSKERHLGQNSLENFMRGDATCCGRGVRLCSKRSQTVIESELSPFGYFSCLVIGETLLGQLFVAGARASVVGVGIDADAATRGEEASDLNILGVHEADEILHDGVDAVLMEVAVVAEGEEVELEALRLHHALVGDVHDLDLGEVGLTRDGAEGGELGTVELHPVVVLGMFVLEGLEHLGCVVCRVAGLLAQLLQAFVFSIFWYHGCCVFGGYSSKSKLSNDSSVKASIARRSFLVGRPVPRARSTKPLMRVISSSSYWSGGVTFS